MSLLTVDYKSYSKLSCAGCLPAEVVLCLPKELVGSQNICVADAPAPYEFSYINAQLISYMQLLDTCHKVYYRYVFSYDDTQLVSSTVLTCADIEGVFCKGCLTQWIEDKVGNEVQVEVSELGTVTITTQHGCEYEFETGSNPEIDPSTGNNLEATIDGLLVTFTRAQACSLVYFIGT